MKTVYILRSESDSSKHYTGIAEDFAARLLAHNGGQCLHTSKHMPWRPMVQIRFEDDVKANAFERYLKSGSGRAFAKKHF